MYKNKQNAIQRARISSGLTQEALAERAGYSIDSVRAYESGARRVPEEALRIFSQVLNASWLGGVYIQERSDILDELIPEFEVGKPQIEAAAGYISCMYELEDMDICRTLIRMLADGKIDEMERPQYEQIKELARKNMKTCLELIFAEEKE